MNQRSTSSSPRRGEDGALGALGEGNNTSPRRSEPPHPSPLPTGERGKRRRRIRYAAVGLVAVLCVAIGAVWGVIDSFGPAPVGRDLELSKTVLDRNGRLLRSYVTSQGRWRLPATREQVDPRFFDVLFAYEDKRFFQHHGVDPLAFGRAALQFVTHGHIVSGGSTISMQVARLLEPRRERSLYVKLREAVRAIQLERNLSKDEILRLYLTLAPYGGNLEGIRAASLSYFGKEPRRLTLGEAALLVALPQSPELRRPDRFHASAVRARDRVLDRMARHGMFDAAEIERAKLEPVPHVRKKMPMIAPHAADDAMAGASNTREIRLTIDGGLQKTLEGLALDRARALGPDMSVAIMVVDGASGEVLARVASPDYFDERRAGQVDLTRAVRSPGSALKPFIYGLGFEDGLIHPETLIEDRPLRYGSYAPENFDLTFQGTVTIRRALQQSLNVPGRRGARRGRPKPADSTSRRGGCGARAAAARGAWSCARPWRRRHQALRPHHALCRLRARRHRAAPHRANGRSEASSEAPARAGRSVVRRQDPARHPAAGKRRRRAHRLQDRHELRLSRRLGGRLRRQAHHRRVGRTA